MRLICEGFICKFVFGFCYCVFYCHRVLPHQSVLVSFVAVVGPFGVPFRRRISVVLRVFLHFCCVGIQVALELPGREEGLFVIVFFGSGRIFQ